MALLIIWIERKIKMAYKKKNDNVNTNVVEETQNIEETVDVVEEVVEKPIPVVVKEKRTFANTDEVDCESIVSGEMILEGIKSENLYKWAGRGEIIGVEYQDLVAAIRMSKRYITEPFFIIRDEDFLEKFPQIDDIYKGMYSIADLQDVLIKTTPASMIETIKTLPHGAQESVKNIAATLIKDGRVDSVKKIKALDEYFHTNFSLMSELFN